MGREFFVPARTLIAVKLLRTCTFVVDYGQNMELPKFGQEQPGVTYYYSPMTVNNFGMVNHAHVCYLEV